MEIDIYAKDKTKAGVKSAENTFTKMAKTLGPLMSAAFGVAVIKGATDAYIKQEQAILQLEQRIKSTGGAAGKTAIELQETAAALQRVTTFGDEATIELQALLLTFTQIKGDQFDEATIAIQNVATAMGTDLKSAALQVGKALNEPAGQLSALSRSGIQFTKEQKAMIKEMTALGDVAGAQTIILKELETQFGGAAEAAAQGLGGSIKQLQNTFGDTLEVLGKSGTGLIPLLKETNKLLGEFNKTIEDIDGSVFTETLTDIGLGFSAISSGIGSLPDLPDWMKSEIAGGIFLANLPIALQILAGIGSEQRFQAAPGSTTFAAPVPPEELFKGMYRPGAGPQQPAVGDTEDTGAIKTLGDPMFGIDAWLVKHDDAQEIKKAAALEKEAEHYSALQELAMQDDELRATMLNERIEAEQRGADILADISRQTVALKQREADGIASITNSLFSTLMTITKGKSKAIFLLQQGVAFGSAIMAAHQASALALANPPGPPATIPMSKIALAMGYANAAAIAAATLTGKGSTSATGGGGTGSAITPVVSQPVSDIPAPESRAITIQIMGNVVDQDKFARELIPSITRAINDGKTLEYA